MVYSKKIPGTGAKGIPETGARCTTTQQFKTQATPDFSFCAR
ncbi:MULTISPECIES: hypothetical protein [Okeania]|nr:MULTISPECIES: hypothetical protein [Okeania]